MRRTKHLITSVLILLLCPMVSFSQVHSVQHELIKLLPNSNILEALEKNLQNEKKCDDFNSKLIWTVAVAEYKGGCIIDVTMISKVTNSDRFNGFFTIGSTTFLVAGEKKNDLFEDLEAEKVLLPTKKMVSSDQTSIDNLSPPEDYSTWVYYFKDNQLSLQKEYTLPCN